MAIAIERDVEFTEEQNIGRKACGNGSFSGLLGNRKAE